MLSFFEQMEVVREEMGLNSAEFAPLIGYGRSTITNWRSGLRERPRYDKVDQLARRLLIGFDWLMDYGKGPRWNYETRQTQAALKELVVHESLTTARERLVMVWNKVHELQPSLEEDIWAAYLSWWEIRKGEDGVPTITQWYECKHGEREPTARQLQGAATVTGLPIEWFENGTL